MLHQDLALDRGCVLRDDISRFSLSIGIFDLVNQGRVLEGLETEQKVPIPALVIFGITIRRLALSEYNNIWWQSWGIVAFIHNLLSSM